MQAYFHSRVGRLCHSGAVKGERHVSSKNNRRLTKVSFLSTLPSSVTLHPIRDHHPGGGRELFCPRWAFAGELRFCEAKWEFLKLPSNFSGESPERSAGDLPSPEKGLARLAYSLASALVYGSLSLTTFFGKGQGLFRWWASFAVPSPWSRLPGVGGLCGTHPLPPPAPIL